MNDKELLGRLIVGTAVSFVILYILEQIDSKLAMLYLIVAVLVILITYKDQIFPSISLLIGTIQGTLK